MVVGCGRLFAAADLVLDSREAPVVPAARRNTKTAGCLRKVCVCCVAGVHKSTQKIFTLAKTAGGALFCGQVQRMTLMLIRVLHRCKIVLNFSLVLQCDEPTKARGELLSDFLINIQDESFMIATKRNKDATKQERSRLHSN